MKTIITYTDENGLHIEHPHKEPYTPEQRYNINVHRIWAVVCIIFICLFFMMCMRGCSL